MVRLKVVPGISSAAPLLAGIPSADPVLGRCFCFDLDPDQLVEALGMGELKVLVILMEATPS